MTTDTHTRRAAVIGLGSMGSGMAGSLLRAGFSVAACDVNPEAVARFEVAGGRGAANPAEAADGADVVVSVVVNAAQTEAVLFGENGAAAAMPVGAVFVSSATMDPAIARALAARLEATGRHYLDLKAAPWPARSTNSATKPARARPSR
jgi:L-threonate 2-dehydrogenase